MICSLKKRIVVDQTGLERDLSALLLVTLVVGRRAQSQLIEVALEIECRDLMNTFDIRQCHASNPLNMPHIIPIVGDAHK